MEKKAQINICYVVAAIWAVVLVQRWWSHAQSVHTVPYSEFQTLLRDNKTLRISIAEHYFRGTLREATPDGRREIHTLRVEPDLAEGLQKFGVEFSGIAESKLLANPLSWVVPIAVFFGLWLFVIRRFANIAGRGDFMPVGKSKAKIYMEKDTQVTFDDVADVDEAKEELQVIDRAVRSLISDAFDRATAILDKFRSQLDITAAKLLEQETLLARDLLDLAD